MDSQFLEFVKHDLAKISSNVDKDNFLAKYVFLKDEKKGLNSEKNFVSKIHGLTMELNYFYKDLSKAFSIRGDRNYFHLVIKDESGQVKCEVNHRYDD